MALFFYKEKNKDIRAAAYLRLSIEDGDKAESNSIGNQRELIRDFAAERPGLHLVEEYADDGYTGTNFERPAFQRLFRELEQGTINCVLVKDLSRFGRNYIEVGRYLERIFPVMRVRLIAVTDNYDSQSAFALFLSTMGMTVGCRPGTMCADWKWPSRTSSTHPTAGTFLPKSQQQTM